jgi:hypothetical protein
MSILLWNNKYSSRTNDHDGIICGAIAYAYVFINVFIEA